MQRWLAREGTVLILGPHHDVGISADLNERAMEYAHHGDALVPRQQRFGKYTRSLMKGLGVPVENRYGLRPGVVAGHEADRAADHQSRPRHARLARRRDELQLPQAPAPLRGHQRRRRSVHVLGRQPIDLSKPHPFTEAGNREFNSFVWMPPEGAARRRGAARRLDDLQHAVWRRRQPEAFLEEPRDRANELRPRCRPPRSVDRPSALSALLVPAQRTRRTGACIRSA